MPGLVNALVIVAVAALVITRQFAARRIDDDRRWWLLPAILTVMAVRSPGILDAQHRAASACLLAAELLIAVATGAGWAWTTRIWVEADGAVWSRTTRAGAAVWAGGIALRLSLFGLGTALGIHQDSSALLLALALTLLVRSGILVLRAGTVHGADGPATAYGDRTAGWAGAADAAATRPARKERV
ncbi:MULTISPECIES: DUF1453 domain-containing protein [Streptomyces]|uniref:DUF1453 domain-containing protein n=2 Tax=Streptomyces TaxID=1883 RepID=A0A2U9P8R3_STRAS|nr:DUF1453 domain-containing protein [Streptomyces actuosus]AWT45932.1 DUF1453 domain-containing protein [Streptomyces actuosus]MBM4822581.1 DUF1453 domain-containing protein [Streptomyces actuosus]